MKRLVTAVVVVLVVVVFAVYLWRSRQQERLRQEQEAAARRTVPSLRLEALITRTGARTDWERSIAGNGRLMAFKVYTMDLQRAWIGSRPILFLGTVKDVSAAGEDRYRVLFDYSPVEYFCSRRSACAWISSAPMPCSILSSPRRVSGGSPSLALLRWLPASNESQVARFPIRKVLVTPCSPVSASASTQTISGT